MATSVINVMEDAETQRYKDAETGTGKHTTRTQTASEKHR